MGTKKLIPSEIIEKARVLAPDETGIGWRRFCRRTGHVPMEI
jgi:hypothetical protein